MPSDLAADHDRTALFHPCQDDPDCPYCNGTKQDTPCDWSFLDGAYCISLQSRAERTDRATKHFHALGLCRHVTFYRPERHPTRVVAGIWESHRAVAMDALARGLKNVLIMEDDVRFMNRATPKRIARIPREIAKLPADWRIYFLGHWPFWARFHTPFTLRVSSACAHAYIANRPLLQWLEAHSFDQRRHLPRRQIAGKGIDAYYAMLPETFAALPMLAIQDGSASDHFAEARAKRSLRLHHLITKPLWFEKVFARLPLLFEAYAVFTALPVVIGYAVYQRLWGGRSKV
ncbi:hypothetical protein SAMN07250955_106179 [Arboricoccus pini]|uniref:Glycosyl transferase, family 25 n=1 Tax=Arboricoccus pini TaxID=1963835 RepID=A0A212R8N7_9PROT|nr:hypothetical protein [Arboricoccus pini]SNB68373.1 hypothetical protein SAMN07250955_106179 [Arboricoccus pini]